MGSAFRDSSCSWGRDREAGWAEEKLKSKAKATIDPPVGSVAGAQVRGCFRVS